MMQETIGYEMETEKALTMGISFSRILMVKMEHKYTIEVLFYM
jgi:hypothetical protein